MINGMLVLTNNFGQLALVDAVAGTLKSMHKIGGPADMVPLAASGLLVQLLRDGRLTAYS